MRLCLVGAALVAVGTVFACGGEEFADNGGGASGGGTPGTGGTAAGGAPTGGTAGSSSGGTAGSSPGGTGGTAGGAAGGGGVAAGGSTGGTAGSGGGSSGGGGGAGVGCGNLHPSEALFYTTLDDSAAVITPAKITAGSPQHTGGSFEDGYCGNGFGVNNPGEYIKVSAFGNINLLGSTLDFFFKPGFESTDPLTHRLLAILPNVLLLVRSNAGELTFGIGGSPFATVAAANVPFVKDQWVRITVVWKTSAADMTQIYFDGAPAPLSFKKTGPFSPPTLSTEEMWIGAFTTSDQSHANGVFDDFRIYNGQQPP